MRGAKCGFKASGGIRTVADAAVYIALTREALGSVTPQRFRLGASGLMTDILAVLNAAPSSAVPKSTSSY